MTTHLEPLERRRLLAASVAFEAGGTLRVTGTDAADVIEFERRGEGEVAIYHDGAVAGVFDLAGVRRFAVDALGGDDTVILGARPGRPARVDGGAGDDLIGGGSLGDHLLGGDGDDTLDGGYGTDTLDGGAGDDTLYTGPTEVALVPSRIRGAALLEGSPTDRVGPTVEPDLAIGGAGEDVLDAAGVAVLVDGVEDVTVRRDAQRVSPENERRTDDSGRITFVAPELSRPRPTNGVFADLQSLVGTLDRGAGTFAWRAEFPGEVVVRDSDDGYDAGVVTAELRLGRESDLLVGNGIATRGPVEARVNLGGFDPSLGLVVGLDYLSANQSDLGGDGGGPRIRGVFPPVDAQPLVGLYSSYGLGARVGARLPDDAGFGERSLVEIFADPEADSLLAVAADNVRAGRRVVFAGVFADAGRLTSSRGTSQPFLDDREEILELYLTTGAGLVSALRTTAAAVYAGGDAGAPPAA